MVVTSYYATILNTNKLNVHNVRSQEANNVGSIFYFTSFKIHSNALKKCFFSMLALRWFKAEIYEGETTQWQQR